MSVTTIKVDTSMKRGFKTDVNCSNAFFIDQPEAAGGTNAGPNPLEVFLSSLGGCICAIGRIISNQQHLKVRSIDVSVEGDIDKNFLLGATTQGRAGFTSIRSFVEIDADMSDEEKEKLIKDIARRCPIADNIINTSKVQPQLVKHVNV